MCFIERPRTKPRKGRPTTSPPPPPPPPSPDEPPRIILDPHGSPIAIAITTGAIPIKHVVQTRASTCSIPSYITLTPSAFSTPHHRQLTPNPPFEHSRSSMYGLPTSAGSPPQRRPSDIVHEVESIRNLASRLESAKPAAMIDVPKKECEALSCAKQNAADIAQMRRDRELELVREEERRKVIEVQARGQKEAMGEGERDRERSNSVVSLSANMVRKTLERLARIEGRVFEDGGWSKEGGRRGSMGWGSGGFGIGRGW